MSGSATVAQVISATELSETQVSALSELLSRKLNKEVEVSASTDPSLLGGLYIHVDGCVIDRSVKKQISDMKDSLKRSKV